MENEESRDPVPDDTPERSDDSIDHLHKFKLDLIESHNQYRISHQSPTLSPADDLNKQAQEWADTIAQKGFLQYSETQGVGENVSFMECSADENEPDIGAHVAKRWYEEQSQYDYESPRWRRGVNNFTQMIWRATQEMGVGICRLVDNTKKRYVIVTQYRPAGNSNMPGEFRKNVPRPNI